MRIDSAENTTSKAVERLHAVRTVEPPITWAEQHVAITDLVAIDHRVVHGGRHYRQPQLVTPEVMHELRRLIPYAPDHLPAEINLIETSGRRYPTLPQVACFDTAFR